MASQRAQARWEKVRKTFLQEGFGLDRVCREKNVYSGRTTGQKNKESSSMCIQDGASVGGAESGSQASSRVDVRLGIRQELRLRKNVWGDGKSGRTIRGVEKAGLICVTRETAFFLLPLRACTLSCIIEKDAGIATKGVLCRMFLRENVEEALEAYKGACKTARIGHKASSEETAAEEAREGYY